MDIFNFKIFSLILYVDYLYHFYKKFQKYLQDLQLNYTEFGHFIIINCSDVRITDTHTHTTKRID